MSAGPCVPDSDRKEDHGDVYITTAGIYDLCGDCGRTWERDV